MKLHYLQHAPTEGIGAIEDWARERGDTITGTHLYRGDPLPELAAFDFLVIMGGAMNVHQHRDHPWLPVEKALIGDAIRAHKPVLGICLGAQLIADVLGAKVTQNSEIEIGWFPVRFQRHPLLENFPPELMTLHWHGDTFSLPDGAESIAASDACAQQGFVYGDRVVGLQFHPEVRPRDVEAFVGDFSDDLNPRRFVQGAEAIREGSARHAEPVLAVFTNLLLAMAAHASLPEPAAV